MIDEFMQLLKHRLQIEFNMQDRSGVYGFTQRAMAYNSNKIEGSTLTEKQTASIFETGTLYSETPDAVFRTKDVEETTGHFKMFNFVLNTIEQPLSEELILQMHRNLKEGVFQDILNGYTIGEYKKRANMVSNIVNILPKDVPTMMKELLTNYHVADVSLDTVVRFHATFEKIHPFQDGNGRVGRMIMFRECLHNDIVPIIVKSDDRMNYLKLLNDAQNKEDFSGLLKLICNAQFNYVKQVLDFVCDYDNMFDLEEIKSELLGADISLNRVQNNLLGTVSDNSVKELEAFSDSYNSNERINTINTLTK